MTTTYHPATKVGDCKIVTLPHHLNKSGTLTVAENSNALPFAVQRIYYIYDIPAAAERGGHSLYLEQKLIVAVAGCIDVTVFDGTETLTFTLRRPYEALYVPPGLWRTLGNFSSGSVALVLSSTHFDEADYVRDLDTFINLKSQNQ